jgi:chromosome segregation ATPase
LAQEPVKSVDLTSVTIEQNNIKREFNSLRGEVSVLKNKNAKAESRISALESLNKDLSLKLDSLQKESDNLANDQKADKSELSTIIGETNEKVLATEQILSSRTLWGICGIIALIVALAATVWAFMKKIKSGSTSIDDVRKAQSSLEEAQENIRKAQEKMQEETIQLDNKLIEVLSKQSVSAPTTTDDGEIDHSLTLKVADEIVKIEMNLSRMDESIKGYKQLSRGVQRIKDNFKANDYEIVDMLGKPYQAGMKAAVTFVTDDTLEPGQQIISRIIKPQVNYKQVMIQAAQIEVSQAE